ncbi:MAG: hypothetical protein BAJATHORv1_90036 [Candidatus Thorarchaeota archaeon]|nr:MAG: hypothetical protein BAJATHORv1_90036 [Candidatus Thorarchaeota archaeon]
MYLKFYYDSTIDPAENPINKGIQDAIEKLKEMAKIIRIDIFDTKGWPEDKLSEAYETVMKVAIMNKTAIRRIYGTAQQRAIKFAKEIPSLIVYDDSKGYAVDVYPKLENGKVIPIIEYISDYTSNGQR